LHTVGERSFSPCKSAPSCGDADLKVLRGGSTKSRYTSSPVPKTTMYFAYGSMLDPDHIARVAPGAKFLFTAHYPETKLGFVISGENGAVPTLVKDSGHTVWGGVFEIPPDQLDSLAAAEKSEGRTAGYDEKAVDREGNKYSCLAFVATKEVNGDHRPSSRWSKGHGIGICRPAGLWVFSTLKRTLSSPRIPLI